METASQWKRSEMSACLRRTLLYGNFELISSICLFKRFKKNIVVWKQPGYRLIQNDDVVFKKNIVVWKRVLNISTSVIPNPPPFKKNIVVWKLLLSVFH